MNKLTLICWRPSFSVCPSGCFSSCSSVIYLLVDCLAWKVVSHAICFCSPEVYVYSAPLISKDKIHSFRLWQAIQHEKAPGKVMSDGFRLGLDFDTFVVRKLARGINRSQLKDFGRTLMKKMYDLDGAEVSYIYDLQHVPIDVVVRRVNRAIEDVKN